MGVSFTYLGIVLLLISFITLFFIYPTIQDLNKYQDSLLNYKPSGEFFVLDYSRLAPCNIGFVDTPIYSLRTGQGMSGSIHGSGSVGGVFVLGFGGMSGSSSLDGNIQSFQQYFFYQAEGPGYILKDSPASSTIIVEDSNMSPVMRKVQVSDSRQVVYMGDIFYSKNDVLNFDYAGSCLAGQSYSLNSYSNQYTYLIVPEGTIKEQYNV